MPLWGGSTTDESKPKWLTEEEKANCYATPAGWVYKQPNGTEEILVAFRGLATELGAPTISAVYFANTAATYVQGHTNAYVAVVYNEKVVVSGSPTLNVNGSDTDATATYTSGSGTNKLLFKFTVPSVAQTLQIDGQTITTAQANNLVDAANTSVNASPTFANSVVVGVQAKAGANAVLTIA